MNMIYIFIILIIIVILFIIKHKDTPITEEKEQYAHPEQIEWLIQRKDFEINPILRPQTDMGKFDIYDIHGTELDQNINNVIELKIEGNDALETGDLIQEEPQIDYKTTDSIKNNITVFSYREPIEISGKEQDIPFTQRFNPSRLYEDMKRSKFIK